MLLTGLSINAILLLSLTHIFFPTLRPSTIQYFTLSYYDAPTGMYYPGINDLKHVVFWIIVFTGLRAGVMDLLLIPCAKRCGMTKKKTCIRFAEQAWILIYYAIFWGVGMVSVCLLYTSPSPRDGLLSRMPSSA